jgi:ribokinase
MAFFPNYAWLMSDISVLGIFVADISFSGPKIPAVGETILGNKYNVGPGGKGCNQAVAIARLGGKVNFISKIGKDAYGKLALETLKKITLIQKILSKMKNYKRV